MKFRIKLVIGCSLFLVLSCSSTKLMDSWKSQNFDSLSSAKILIISQTPEDDIRKSFEIDIANKLRSKNIDAIESHVEFPLLEEATTPEAQNKIVKQFEEAGITAIILTSLKQTIETQKGGFGTSTEVPQVYKNKSSFNPTTVNTRNSNIATSKTYVLESLTYNLLLEGDKQLVNVCLVDVTDPDSGDKIRKAFTQIIAGQFN